MFRQTVDQLLPFLQLLQQPAFCLRISGEIDCNREARVLCPVDGESLSAWLGESASIYEQWDREGTLVLPVPLGSNCASVTVQPLSDGTLFLLSNMESSAAGEDSMAVTAQVLRQPLSELSSLTQSLAEELEETEDPVLQEQSASITRQIYRISRIACNLADWEQLRSGTYPPHPERLAIPDFFLDLMRELEDICHAAGRTLNYVLPDKPTYLVADPMLLERGILNLLSNAIKYGTPADPIVFHVELSPTSLQIRIRNTCSNTDGELLRAAFQRLTQRGVLPDPQWGLGLGLPMARYIAQLMGGTVAVEVNRDHIATVTLSISRTKPFTEVRSPIRPPVDYTGGMRRSLVELSDVLPDDCFGSVSI